MTRVVAASFLALLLAVAVGACGGDPPEGPALARTASPSIADTPAPPTSTPAATEADAPSPTSSPATAATATAAPGEAPPLPDSVRELLAEVADVRGLEAPPTLRALTVAQVDVRDLYVDLVTEEERLQLDRDTTLYRLLGYLDEDEHLWDITMSFLDLVLGFYAPSEKTLWVVTDREGVGLEELSPPQRQTLVHEILHALQDYHFDLDATSDRIAAGPEALDAMLAFAAVIEGDAVVHTDRHGRRFFALPAGGGLFFLAEALQLGELPAPIIRELYFPYTTGAHWVREVLANEGVEALNTFLTEPPPATTLILHPDLLDTGWEPERIRDSSIPEGQIRESLGPGWPEPQVGALGEFQLINYLLGDAPSFTGWLRAPRNRTAVDAAAGWAADRYYLFENGEGEAVLVARVRFVGEEDAREFAEAHRAVATEGADVVVDGELTLATGKNGTVVGLFAPVGRDVIFAIGTSAEAVRAALEPLRGG